MSKFVICCIRDTAADSFNVPIFLRSTGVAIRTFTDEVNRAADDNPLYKHPDDHDLYMLGHYEQETGEFEIDAPRMLARGKDVKAVSDAIGNPRPSLVHSKQ